MSAPAPPEKLSHYRLIERIGQGAMGEVWMAEDTALPRRVAIKLLSPRLRTDDESVERLMREARAAATVDHPNVVTVFEVGMHEQQPYVVMQLVEGETLETRLARGPMGVPEVITMARGIADALAEVHALGIVHRDLKPANVVLTPRGPRVLDFGIAAMQGDPRLTATGTLIGTPVAMSPEQFQGRPPDARSDLWSLGVLLYEALTGDPPFGGATLQELAHRVVNEQPPPPSRRNPGVGGELDLVIGKLLRKDPALRYARAEDLLADLEAAARGTKQSRAGTGVTAEPRLAVLYFDVLSADPEDRFLADGLTEDLIVDLARVSGVRVSARGEVLPYRDRSVPPRTVARELATDYVVQGSVRRAGPRARISAQLVRAADGHAVWAERFDRTLDDLFEVQAEVSRRIVEALSITLRPAEQRLLERPPTSSREAYMAYLRGQALSNEIRRDNNQRAEQEFRKAIAVDPGFALAHAALAACYAERIVAWWAGPEILDLARRHARQALELDAALPMAHVASGMIHRIEGDAAAVLEDVRKAQLLDSTDASIMQWVGVSYMRLGRPADAIAGLERAIALHPRNYQLMSVYADCLVLVGRGEELPRILARINEVLIEVLERDPDADHARSILAIALVQSGQRDAGLAQVQQLLARPTEDNRVVYNLACAYTAAGLPDRAMEQLTKLAATGPGLPKDWPPRDPDLAPLRGRPDFEALFGSADAAS